MFINIIKSYREIIAICDSNLIGKIFEEGKFQLDLKESFFKGEEKSKEELIKIMKNMAREDAIFNIVGKNSIDCAIDAGIVSKDGIKKIQDIPFAMVLI